MLAATILNAPLAPRLAATILNAAVKGLRVGSPCANLFQTAIDSYDTLLL